MLARLSVLAALLLLASCAAVPGYSPPPLDDKKPKSSFGKALESGDVDADGRYEMSATEKQMDCKRLAGSIQIGKTRLRDAIGREEPSTVSSTAQKMKTSAAAAGAQKTVTPVLGGSALPADREAVYARERAKLDAYNSELGAKGCPMIDIDAELARPPEGPKKY
jgi:hypothetical protein